MSTNQHPKRYSISVSGKTYERLRASVPDTMTLQKFVEGIFVGMFDDPMVLERMIKKCRPRELRESREAR